MVTDPYLGADITVQNVFKICRLLQPNFDLNSYTRTYASVDICQRFLTTEAGAEGSYIYFFI